MSDFEKAVHYLLENEGGYTADPDPTNYGVTLSTLRRNGELAAGDYDGDGDIDADDILRMTREDAIHFYRVHWWERYGYGEIDSDESAQKIFDLSVNMGPGAAHRLGQAAINMLYGYVLLEDGILGPRTLARINRAPYFLFVGELRAQAWRRYKRILEDFPHLEKYRNGWRNRAYK